MATEKSVTVIVITSWHHAFDGRIFYKQCRTIAQFADVYLFSPGINGKICGMDGKCHEEGIYNQVHCYSLHTRARKRSLIQKILRKLEQFTGIEKVRIFRQVMAHIFQHDIYPDIVHVHEPDLIPVARKIADKYGSKVIFDSHEMHVVYPIDRFGMPGALISLFCFYRDKIYARMCDAVIAVNDLIRSYYLSLNPDIENVVIQNSSLFPNRKDERKRDKITLVHEGSLTFSRGLKIMCEVFSNKWMQENCCLRYVGKMGEGEKKYLSRQAPEVRKAFIDDGWVDMDSLHKKMDGDIGVILMQPRFNNLLAGPPNKFYNYLALGMPVLTVDLPATRSLVERYGVGEVCQRDSGDIIEKLRIIAGNIEQYRHKIEAAGNEFTWEKEGDKLYRLYTSLTR